MRRGAFRWRSRGIEVSAVPRGLLIPDGRYAGYFLLRRLHSLTGVVPLTFFLFQHIFVNSLSLQGHDSYQAMAKGLRSLPYLFLVEFIFILAPLYFHGFLGLFLTYRGDVTVFRYPFARNWMYFLQRATGVFVVAFVTYHILHTRFSGEEDLFVLMAESLANPLIFAVYLVGVVTSSYHLANGLWNFAIRWGISTGRRAQALGTLIALGIFAVLSVASINSLLGFLNKGIRLFH